MSRTRLTGAEMREVVRGWKAPTARGIYTAAGASQIQRPGQMVGALARILSQSYALLTALGAYHVAVAKLPTELPQALNRVALSRRLLFRASGPRDPGSFITGPLFDPVDPEAAPFTPADTETNQDAGPGTFGYWIDLAQDAQYCADLAFRTAVAVLGGGTDGTVIPTDIKALTGGLRFLSQIMAAAPWPLLTGGQWYTYDIATGEEVIDGVDRFPTWALYAYPPAPREGGEGPPALDPEGVPPGSIERRVQLVTA